MNKYVLFLSLVCLLFSCGTSADKTETTARDSTSTAADNTSEYTTTATDDTYDGTAPAGTKTERQQQTLQLINIANQTMDSIDAAYTSIRNSSRNLGLTLEEREHVNEALLQMNIVKELILLETQKEIIFQLQQKANTLNSVIIDMNKTSERLNHISATVAKVSGIIEKTTNVLSSGLTMGIIKPKSDIAAN